MKCCTSSPHMDRNRMLCALTRKAPAHCPPWQRCASSKNGMGGNGGEEFSQPDAACYVFGNLQFRLFQPPGMLLWDTLAYSFGSCGTLFGDLSYHTTSLLPRGWIRSKLSSFCFCLRLPNMNQNLKSSFSTQPLPKLEDTSC